MSKLKVYNNIYKFSNENLSAYDNIYNFKDAKVLTVIGSGDQYFTSLLNGAKEVDLFDINYTSYLYFVLKFVCIKKLTYDEFYNMFVLNRFFNSKIYSKIIKDLPIDVSNYYRYLINSKPNKFLFDISILEENQRNRYFSNNSIIPYLSKEKYYELQKILNELPIPNFKYIDICKSKIDKEYDLILLSNIYDYLNMNLEEYKEFLCSLKTNQIQSMYRWSAPDYEYYNSSGFKVDEIAPSGMIITNKNYVLSLMK